MRDLSDADRALAGVALVRDEELAGAESGTAARALFTAIMTEASGPMSEPATATATRPAAPGGRRTGTRRIALAAGATAVVTAGAVVVPALLGDRAGGATSYANAAIDVRLDGRFYVARIKDPLADRERYAEAFRAVGKNVDVDLVPVSPRYVGQILRSGSSADRPAEVMTEFEPSGPERVDCFYQPDRCTLTIKISKDTTATVTYTIGRAARPGETLHDPARTG